MVTRGLPDKVGKPSKDVREFPALISTSLRPVNPAIHLRSGPMASLVSSSLISLRLAKGDISATDLASISKEVSFLSPATGAMLVSSSFLPLMSILVASGKVWQNLTRSASLMFSSLKVGVLILPANSLAKKQWTIQC